MYKNDINNKYPNYEEMKNSNNNEAGKNYGQNNDATPIGENLINMNEKKENKESHQSENKNKDDNNDLSCAPLFNVSQTPLGNKNKLTDSNNLNNNNSNNSNNNNNSNNSNNNNTNSSPKGCYIN